MRTTRKTEASPSFKRCRPSPRNLTAKASPIDPSGTFLIAANAHTDNVVVFRIDRETGQLEFTGSEIKVPAATCVEFLPVKK